MLKNYIKIAWKVFMRRKFFTFVSLFGISFTLTVLMIATAVFDNMFAPSPPETNQDRMLYVTWAIMEGKAGTISGPGYPFITRFVKTLPGIEMASASSWNEQATSFKDGNAIKLQLKRTDGEFWKILDFRFLEGRPLTVEDDTNANFVAVVSQSTKEKFFGVESGIGKYIEAGLQRFRVVGVVADVPYTHSSAAADIWVPIGTSPSTEFRTQQLGKFRGLILMHSPADAQRVGEEFDAQLAHVPLPTSEYNVFMSMVQTHFNEVAQSLPMANWLKKSPAGLLEWKSYYEAKSQKVVLFLVLGALLFMLLPALNLISLNLSRMMERASEIGVRKSFGASAAALVGQFLVENLLLTALGGILGFLVSSLLLHALSSSSLFHAAEFHFNFRLFLYGLGLIFFFGLISGIYPAWKMARFQPVKALAGSRV
jgi:putative ABC transport system permease protein